MSAAVVLIAHGAPDRREQIPSFLTSVLGAPPAGALIAEIRARYERIGGASPLNAISRRQAEALSRVLSLPVVLAFRHGRPTLAEAVSEARAAGCDHVVAVWATPQYGGKSGDRRNFPHVLHAPSVHRHPLFIEAVAEKLAPLAPGREVLFTVHSVPARVARANPDYEAEARATAAAIASRSGVAAFEFAYQSQGQNGGDWLGPTVESRIDALASRGVSDVVVAPLSFSADNLEVLYDIDVHFRQYAAGRGIRLSRTPTLGDSPLFIEALAATVRPLLEAAA